MNVAQRTRTAYSLAVIAASLLLTGCNKTQSVGSHQYRVPEANLVPKSSYPFFSPPSKDDGFIFILNPSAEQTEQRSVVVEERATLCARAAGRKAHVNSTICAPQEVEWRGRRWFRSGDDTFWTYGPEMPSGSTAPFVSCFKVEGHPGLCRATLAAGDLALTIGLNADELPALEDRFDEAVSALKTWEV